MGDRNEKKTSEGELLRQARAGDQRAFEELIRMHERRVFSLGLRLTGSPDEAQDIYQEVFLRVFTGLTRFRGHSAFSTWVYRITINVCMTHLEMRRKRGQIEQPTAGPMLEEVGPPQEDTPESRLLGSETGARVEEALRALPPQQRLVFTLRHYEGYKLREIARMIGCREGTVKRYLFDATHSLRQRLHDLL